MFGIIANILGHKHNINTNMSHEVLNIRIITNFVANDVNTNMSHIRKMQFATRKGELCFYVIHKEVKQLGLFIVIHPI